MNNLITPDQLGGLATIGEQQLTQINKRMVEMNRANHTAGRQNTQTTNQLMALTMLADSPYRRLRQCLAQIEKKRNALDDAFFRMKKQQIKVKKWRDKGDELSLVKADEAEYKAQRSKDYIDAAFKEIAVFQEAYEEIRLSNNIPEKWDEKDAELEEITHHIRMAFRNCVRDLIQDGRMNMGTMEYLEQFGIHPQTARSLVLKYLEDEEAMIAKGQHPTVNKLYAFLDHMVETFHDSHKMVMDRIGLETLVRDEYLYLEDKSDVG
jgi:hypothetical protein